MNQDKRRRARVQGGWAATEKPVRSDANKPKVPPAPAWLAKTVDVPMQTTAQKFVYEEPAEEVAQVEKERLIDKAGVYDLSLKPSGVSRLKLFPNFLDKAESEEMFKTLLDDLPWRQTSIFQNGVKYLQPRMTLWFGPLPYSYSGLTHEANNDWPPVLERLKKHLEESTGLCFNSVLANLYRNGHDHVTWHTDNETGMGLTPSIASISLGDTRMFELRKEPPADRPDDFSNMPRVKVPLDAGTLLIMEGSLQDDWQHRVPKEYHDRGPRINLTFRVIHPE
ncbi:alpha-ketoglutarate-dependent dioxygenase alkB-like protein 3 [Lamellibrachia satsuma]|nr:alpha-ketoglutarate-dependent dioxygenase alkB-like protein 3 [Lamellibrachia satsuma]